MGKVPSQQNAQREKFREHPSNKEAGQGKGGGMGWVVEEEGLGGFPSRAPELEG